MAQLMLRYLVYLEPKLGITIQMNCLGVQGKQHAPNMQLKENQGHFTRPHASFGIKEKVPGIEPQSSVRSRRNSRLRKSWPLSAQLKKLLKL